MGGIAVVRASCVEIVVSWRTGIYLFYTGDKVVGRALAVEGEAVVETTLPSAPTGVRWNPLNRAHCPIYAENELAPLLFQHWSQQTKLLALKLDEDRFACALLQLGVLRCTECSQRFNRISDWANHFNSPPLLLPQTLSWSEVTVNDGSIVFKPCPRLELNATPMVARPHHTHTERSLGAGDPKEHVAAITQKLSRFNNG